jgi:hypothetical protein
MFAPKVAKPQTKAIEAASSGLAPRCSTLAGHRLGSGPGEQALFLQRSIGNQATQRLLTQGASRSEPGKLAIGRVDDPLEREADRVADQVMRMPDPGTARGAAGPPGSSRVPTAQRNAEQGHRPVQTASAGASGSSQAEAPPIAHQALRSPAQSLDASAAAFFAPRFGHDFSGVRVHADDRAADAARAVAARAYTVGCDIVFGAGAYAPARARGDG